MLQYTVRESELSVNICVQVRAEAYTKERNVSFTLFSSDETAIGMSAV